MIVVPQAAQDILAAMTDQELRAQINEKRRDLAYGLWEANRRGYSILVVYENPNAALNDNEAREIQISAGKQVQL
jgi:hypothetical protein